MWKNFTKSDLGLCLKEPYEFFLVRYKGTHPARGGKFCPIVVQLIDEQLYVDDNELEPLTFSKAGADMEPSNEPFECDLEWCELPE
jgi:hypothetical protein